MEKENEIINEIENTVAREAKAGGAEGAASGNGSAVRKPAGAKSAGKKPAAKKRSKRRRRRAARVGLAVTLSVMVLLLVGAGVAAFITGHQIREAETIFPGVRAGGVELGGMTKEQAVQALLAGGWDERHAGRLSVLLPADISFELDYYEAGVSVTAEQMAETALAYGRQGGDMDALLDYVHGRSHSVDIPEPEIAVNEEFIREATDRGATDFEIKTAFGEYTLDEEKAVITMLKGGGQMTVDRTALCEQVRAALLRHDSELRCTFAREAINTPDFTALYERLAVEPQDAYYDPATDTIVPEVEGFRFDPEEAKRLWEQTEAAETVTIPVEYLHPSLTAEDLEAMLFRDKLGAKTTYYWGSSLDRMGNISLVAQILDGTVVLPGEEFSFNGSVGERTAERGFGWADAYENGEVVKQIGGGVCQTSSTLYNAVLAANLEISDRTCHDFAIGYLDRGLDATVSYPRPDFKFINNRDFPIMIRSVSDQANRSITFEIWGTNVDGTYVVMTSGSWPRYDTTYPDVQIGWGAVSYRNLYDADGNLISREVEAYSQYDLHPEDIHWPDPTPEPTKTPENTPKPTQPPENTPEPTQPPENTPEPTQPPENTPEPTPEPTPPPTEPPADPPADPPEEGGEDPDVIIDG